MVDQKFGRIIDRGPSNSQIRPAQEEARNGAGKIFWEVDRGGALILPGAQPKGCRRQAVCSCGHLELGFQWRKTC
jgi:hypothetical protein